MRKEKKAESGMVIVEASIVFPVMFLVIFVLIFLGNAYYEKSCIERYVTQTALEAAAERRKPAILCSPWCREAACRASAP
mgnify:CR=1 FL=1